MQTRIPAPGGKESHDENFFGSTRKTLKPAPNSEQLLSKLDKRAQEAARVQSRTVDDCCVCGC